MCLTNVATAQGLQQELKLREKRTHLVVSRWHVPKCTVPFGASDVLLGVWLKTTLCPLGVQQLLELLKGAE